MDFADIVSNFEDEKMKICGGDVDWYDFEESSFDQQTAEDTQPEVQQDGHPDESSSDNSRYHSEAEESEDEQARRRILRQLEDLVHGIIYQVEDVLASSAGRATVGRKIAIELADRKKPLKSDGTYNTRTISFPHKSRHASAKSLAQFLRVMDLIHEALSSGMPTTKRDIYYKDVTLFGSQSVVDRLIDDIAATMNVPRADLCVRASAKGLFCGSSLVLHLHSGDTVFGNDTEGALIPPSEDINRFEVREQLSWVLVVEKEAVFQTLCHLQFSRHPSFPGPGLIVTGKGYPDVATRQLVANLGEDLDPRIPIFALVDADPFGLDILSVYKYGSDSMSHQNDLHTPRLRWVGLMATEFSSLGIEKDYLIPITKYDEKKAFSMLKRTYLPKRWRKEIQHMLFSRRKAEIEVLSASQSIVNHLPGTSVFDGRDCLLVRYLANKLSKALESSVGKSTSSRIN